MNTAKSIQRLRSYLEDAEFSGLSGDDMEIQDAYMAMAETLDNQDTPIIDVFISNVPKFLKVMRDCEINTIVYLPSDKPTNTLFEFLLNGCTVTDVAVVRYYEKQTRFGFEVTLNVDE